MIGDVDDRLERVVRDALDRVERGNAAFIPFTPTLTPAAIVVAVELHASRRVLAVRTEELSTGIHVAPRRT